MAEDDPAEAADVDVRERQSHEEVSVLRREALRNPRPAVLARAFGGTAVGVPADETRLAADAEKPLERLARHGTETNVSSHDDEVGLELRDLDQHGVERWKVPVHVVEGGDGPNRQ